MSTIIIGATLNRAVGDTNIYIVLSKTFVLITGGGMKGAGISDILVNYG